MTVIPVIIGALGTVPQGLVSGLLELEIGERDEAIQTTAQVKSNRVLKWVMETRGDLLSLKLQWKTICLNWWEKLARNNNDNNNQDICKRLKTLEALTQTIRIYTQDIEMEFGIEMCPADIEKLKKTNNRKNQNAWRKEKLQVLGNIWSGHHQTKGKKKEKSIPKERESFSKPNAFVGISPKDETINYIIRERSNQVQNTRQNWVGKEIHSELYKKLKFDPNYKMVYVQTGIRLSSYPGQKTISSSNGHKKREALE